MWEVSSPSPSTAAFPPMYRLPPTQLEKSIPPTLANIYSIYPTNNIFFKRMLLFYGNFFNPLLLPPPPFLNLQKMGSKL